MHRSFRLRPLALGAAALVSTLLAPPALAAPTTVSFGEVRSGSARVSEDCAGNVTNTVVTDGNAELVRTDTAGELRVEYLVEGTGKAGIDHADLPGEIVFPDGADRVLIPFDVLETTDGGAIVELTITPTADVTPGANDKANLWIVPSRDRPFCEVFEIGAVTEALEVRRTECKVDGNLVEEIDRTDATVVVRREDATLGANFVWQVSRDGQVITGPTRTVMIEEEDEVLLTVPAGETADLTFTILPDPSYSMVTGSASVTVPSLVLYADNFFCAGPPTFVEPSSTLTVPAGSALPSPAVKTEEIDDHAGQRVFRVAAGALPTGVTLTEAGAFAGAPSTPGTYAFTIEACNIDGDAEACNAAVYNVTVLETLPLGGADSTTLLWSGLLALAAGGLLVRRSESVASH